jgi:predicted DNA binding CopG/RHH family protein
MDKRKPETTLDSLERQIEKTAGSYRQVSKDKHRKIDSIIAWSKKNRTVSIRISDALLEQLKQRSQEEGLPYQTLITSVLHKYVSNRLVEEDAIRKSILLLRSNR